MNEETIQTPAEPGFEAASDTGGEARSANRQFDPNAAILRDKEGDMGRPKGRRRRRVSYLTINKIDTVDYKDVALLRRFISERGKILSTRQTGNTAKQQRMITSAIFRARELALLPFVAVEVSTERAPRRPRGEGGPRHERTEAPAAAAPEAAAEE